MNDIKYMPFLLYIKMTLFGQLFFEEKIAKYLHKTLKTTPYQRVKCTKIKLMWLFSITSIKKEPQKRGSFLWSKLALIID